MEIFSEVFSRYYYVMEQILSLEAPSKEQISEIVKMHGFSESILYLLPKITGEGGWPLLIKNNNLYESILRSKPSRPISNLELSWLKAISYDERFRLFFTDSELSEISSYLKDVKPLFNINDICFFDKYSDGDPYSSEAYRRNFRLLLHAIKNKNIIKISYRNRKAIQREACCMPLKIEYSQKDDKFRIYCGCSRGSKIKYIIFNIARIVSLEICDFESMQEYNIEQYFAETKCKKPVVINVTQERNALERIMIEFSAYEKYSEFDAKTGICTVKIYYNICDETELLIRLLSFGPVIQVVSPKSFQNKIKERVISQRRLLQKAD